MTLTLTHREQEVVPGVLPGNGPGWYLIAANKIVELGPFASDEDAQFAAEWMDNHGWGRNPAPWTPCWSPRGMTLDTRKRNRRRSVG